MRDAKGMMFSQIGHCDVICITTNGFVKANGQAVMGRGCALTYSKMYPGATKILANKIQRNGNHVSKLGTDKGTEFWSFPVKHNWWENADLELIERSARELVIFANDDPTWTKILIPRPGCGNGHLDYAVVRPILAPILDDRFLIVTF